MQPAMGKFIKVVDLETPRNERNEQDPLYRKHRAFDSPHELVPAKSLIAECL